MDDYRNYYSGSDDNNRHIQDVNFVILQEEEKEKEVKSDGADTSTAEAFTAGGSAEKRKRRFHFKLSPKGSIALLVVICLVASTGFGFGGAMLANHLNASASDDFGQREGASSNIKVTNTGTTIETSTGSNLTIKEIAALNAHSVVEIKTEAVTTDPWMQQYVTEGAGSGVIISADGYIVTNNHVIENSNKITITLKNGKSHEATLVGTDDETDLAVLKIDASGLTPAIYGDSSALEVGDLAVVIGNPLGSLGGTVTAGIISALDRSITIDGKSMTLLQTDASINPGNSGGGLFNQNGELVGIIVAKSAGSGVEGLGFAIPVNKVKTIAQELADYGYVKGRVEMGLTLVDLTTMKNAIFYGVRNLGIYVKSVDSELAKAAGFMEGDMIYYIGDQKIDTAADLTGAFEGRKVGDTINVTIIRDNEMKKLELTLGEKKSTAV